jgi:hypothetical protein
MNFGGGPGLAAGPAQVALTSAIEKHQGGPSL